MSMNDAGGAQARPVWLFMAATAMATTVSTLAASAMVKADAPEPVEVTCSCEAAPAPAPAPASEAPAPEPASEAPAPEAPALAPEAPAEQAPAAAPVPSDAASDPLGSTRSKKAPAADIEGALPKDMIRRIVKAHIGEVRYCYNEGLKIDPELAGRVAVSFTIDANGNVSESEVSDTNLADSDVPDCIATAVERWIFPKPSDGEDVKVTYPFVLEPG
jgi:outer membrane biosynthesis protein TonB